MTVLTVFQTQRKKRKKKKNVCITCRSLERKRVDFEIQWIIIPYKPLVEKGKTNTEDRKVKVIICS